MRNYLIITVYVFLSFNTYATGIPFSDTLKFKRFINNNIDIYSSQDENISLLIRADKFMITTKPGNSDRLVIAWGYLNRNKTKQSLEFIEFKRLFEVIESKNIRCVSNINSKVNIVISKSRFAVLSCQLDSCYFDKIEISDLFNANISFSTFNSGMVMFNEQQKKEPTFNASGRIEDIILDEKNNIEIWVVFFGFGFLYYEYPLGESINSGFQQGSIVHKGMNRPLPKDNMNTYFELLLEANN